MEQITKNKLSVILYALVVSILAFLLIKRQNELWEKAAIIILAVLFVVLHTVNRNRVKYYTLINDVLITRQIYSKQKQYSLKNVSSWTENHYHLLGIKTGREIIIKIKGVSKIKLYEKSSKDFEKLSDYLNKNIPEAFEN